MTSPDRIAPDAAAVDEAAAAWDARLRAPSCTDETREAFRAWRDADPAHRAAFERLLGAVDALRAAGARPELRAMTEAALQLARQQRARRRWAAAAVVLLALGSFASAPFLSSRIGDAHEARMTAALDAPPYYATAVGERSVVTLEDGSIVTLNTSSRVRVDLAGAERAVVLLQGQAHFEVAHDATRPFIVSAGDRRITALGTAFDVRLAADEVTVTLVEGRVSVDEIDIATGEVEPDAPRAELAPGQRLSASSAEPEPDVELADVARVVAWREGRVIFEDDALGDAVSELNRYLAKPIVIEDPAIADLRVNGMFRTGETASFIGALTAYYPVDARERRDGAMVLSWRADAG